MVALSFYLKLLVKLSCLIFQGAASQSKRSYPEISNNGTSGSGVAGSVQNTDLVVLGLPWNFSDQELRDYFEQYGTLEFAHVST